MDSMLKTAPKNLIIYPKAPSGNGLQYSHLTISPFFEVSPKGSYKNPAAVLGSGIFYTILYLTFNLRKFLNQLPSLVI